MVILAYIFIVDAKYQLILNKELAYIGMEQQQIKQISTGEMSAYLSCIDHRLISHDILVAIAGVFFTTIAFLLSMLLTEIKNRSFSRTFRKQLFSPT